MMSRLFKASKVILDSLWFAKEHISDTEINWEGIEKSMNQIVPSDTEVFRYNLAKDIYTENGMIYKLAALDQGNRLRVLEAFKILLEPTRTEL